MKKRIFIIGIILSSLVFGMTNSYTAKKDAIAKAKIIVRSKKKDKKKLLQKVQLLKLKNLKKQSWKIQMNFENLKNCLSLNIYLP